MLMNNRADEQDKADKEILRNIHIQDVCASPVIRHGVKMYCCKESFLLFLYLRSYSSHLFHTFERKKFKILFFVSVY